MIELYLGFNTRKVKVDVSDELADEFQRFDMMESIEKVGICYYFKDRHRFQTYGDPTTYSISSSRPSLFSQSSKDFLEMRIMLPMRIVLNNPEFASL